MITEIGYEVDRTILDARIKFWIQQAIDVVYAAIPKQERQRRAALDTVVAQEYLKVPTDFGTAHLIINSLNDHLRYVVDTEFFTRNKLTDAGSPEEYTYWNNRIYLSPVPDAIESLTLHYDIERPNIYIHNLIIEHQASMGANPQVYIDEDGVDVGEGKLLFVSPTTTDAKVLLQTIDRHRHEIVVYHDVDAATKGVPWYLDEDAANADESNFFLSPTGADTVIKTANYRKHHHYLHFLHNPSPTTFPDSDNVEVYIDEDNVDRTLRLLFISPTLANGTTELVHSVEGEFPGFLERFQSAVYELAVAKGHRFNKNYEAAEQHSKAATGLMSLIIGSAPETSTEEGGG